MDTTQLENYLSECFTEAVAECHRQGLCMIAQLVNITLEHVEFHPLGIITRKELGRLQSIGELEDHPQDFGGTDLHLKLTVEQKKLIVVQTMMDYLKREMIGMIEPRLLFICPYANVKILYHLSYDRVLKYELVIFYKCANAN